MSWNTFGPSRGSGHDGASGNGGGPGRGAGPGGGSNGHGGPGGNGSEYGGGHGHPPGYGGEYEQGSGDEHGGHPGTYDTARGAAPGAHGASGPGGNGGRARGGHGEHGPGSGAEPLVGVGPGVARGSASAGPGPEAAGGSRDSARAGRHPGTPADGTYVPEGGTSPTGPAGLHEWPAMVVLALLAASLVVAAVFGFRPATLMIGGTFTVAAILRLFVHEVGILAVRSRFTDISVMLVFGGAVVLLGLMVPPPLVDLPWVPNRTG